MIPFIQRFNEIKKQHAHSIALWSQNKTISYQDLDDAIDILSKQLRAYGMGPGCLIAINIEKSVDYIIALLAIWKAEAAFMPLEPSLPEARQTFMLTQAKPNLIISVNPKSNYACKLLHIKPQYNQTLAYIIFTSGSTGKPKGVMIPHTGIVPFIDCQIQAFDLCAEDRMLFYVSTQFDASISDIGTTLLSGATLFISTTPIQTALKELAITHIDIPPSLLALLKIQQMPASLRTIIIGGEVCNAAVIRKWAKKFRVVNVYGPTEATVCTSLIICSDDWQEPKIGLPFPHILYKLDNNSELLIAGPNLALGYVNNTLLTQEKFITIDDKRYYRSGDLVKKIKDNYIYLGRVDRQLKINGKLIAPEEIEATIKQHSLILNAAVFSAKRKLIACVETKKLTECSLRHFLQSLLPDWMIPSQFIFLQTFPKHINGKIDFKRLTSAQKVASSLKQRSVFDKKSDAHQNNAISSKTKQLQTLCQQVMKLPHPPSIHADIIDELGADSIDILKIIAQAEIQKIFLSTEIIYHLRTINSIAVWLKFPNISEKMSTDILKQDIVRDSTNYIKKDENFLSKNSNTQGIFLTGATGFLGIHILIELITNTDEQIYCLIRANNIITGRQKLLSHAKSYHIELQPFLNRIHVITGDITLPQLGLSAYRWHKLCQNITTIYHSAAEVNMLKSYNALKPTNLDGTKTIVELALTIRTKHIHYISTLSVFVATERNTGLCKENDNLEKTQFVYGGYAQSKWAAEYYLHHSETKHTIYRLGLITGHSEHGKSSHHDYLHFFVQGLTQIGSYPYGSWNHIQFNATPVDYAAQTLVYLSLHGQAKCYHIANQQQFSLQMVIEAMQRHGMILKPTHNWTPNITNAASAASFIALCRIFLETNRFERYRTMDLFQATDVEFDQTNTLKDMENSQITIHLTAEELLDKYISVCFLP